MQPLRSAKNKKHFCKCRIVFKSLSSGIAPSNNDLLVFSEPTMPVSMPPLMAMRLRSVSLCFFPRRIVATSILSFRITLSPILHHFMAIVHSSTQFSSSPSLSPSFLPLTLNESLMLQQHITDFVFFSASTTTIPVIASVQDDLPFFHPITKVHYPTQCPSIYSNVHVEY